LLRGGAVGTDLPGDLVECLRASGKILGTAPELFLQRGTSVFSRSQRRLAFAQRDSIRLQTGLQIERLRHATLQSTGLFRELRTARVQFRFTCMQPRGLGG
jgi:hypothetical protein